jgi:uncharacterized protein YdeI (YjbR/CyaY-like superfamily)
VITDIEDYFAKGCGRCERFATADCSTRQWLGGLRELRRICLDAQLVETIRWAHPCYRHRDRNIAIIGALRGDFRISFFNAALLKDPAGLLERPGPNSRHPDMIRFTDHARVLELEPILRSYLKEAMDCAEAGLKPPSETTTIELPAELAEALLSDPDLAAAFHRLTPGRQRSYVISLNSLKKPESRISRIARFRGPILAGKGATGR